MDKKRRTVLVTGASRGIGRAIALKFLKEGDLVYGTYNTSSDKISEIENEYGKDNFIVLGPYDFSNLEDTNKLVSDLVGVKLDVLVCNAGMFSENDDFLNFDYHEFEEAFNCNFNSPMLLSIKLQNNINNNGSIIIMSSNDAYSGAFGSISYSVSKAALLSLTKCLCVNYGRRGIRVNSLAPGAINTDMNTPEQEFDAPKFTPIERIGQPEEVAKVAYFLSKDASFINGENITVDGGYTVNSILLQNEIKRVRFYEGYDYIYDLYRNFKEGNTLLHMSPCPFYTWTETEEERNFLEVNIEAEKNGLAVTRILVVPKEREEELKTSEIIKNYFRKAGPKAKTYLIKEADLIEKSREDYKMIGMGYGIINQEKIFIDSYSNSNSIGYMIEGEELINKLTDSFNRILEKIEDNTIEAIKVEW